MKEFIINFKKTSNFLKKERKTMIICIIVLIFITFLSSIVPFISSKLLINLTAGNLNEMVIMSIIIFIVEIFQNVSNVLYFGNLEKYMLKAVSSIQLNMAKETLKLKTHELEKQCYINCDIFY